jgi:hypothetical protein
VWRGHNAWERPAQYELAGQVTHWLAVLERLPTYPALQTQSPRRLALQGDRLFAGQGVHATAMLSVA